MSVPLDYKEYLKYLGILIEKLKISFPELFSGFSEVKMSLKTDVSTSFTSLLQVVVIL